MAQAWLDSLSEDWVSQPASETSFSAQTTQPDNTTKNTTKNTTTSTPNRKANGTRIPRPCHDIPKPETPVRRSSRVLGERSPSDTNIPSSRRRSSKLAQEIRSRNRGRFSGSAVSLSPSNSVLRSSARGSARGSAHGSVVHNTVNHKASTTTPTKTHGETPEWKRRLVYGELSYGEQPDLFTSHATGLEGLFKPPAAPKSTSESVENGTSRHQEEEDDSVVRHEVTLPSSPPIYNRDPSTVDIHVDDSAVVDLPQLPDRRAPTGMRYRRNDESELPSPSSDRSEVPELDSHLAMDSEEGASSATEQHLQVDDDADLRKFSGQTVLNEDFSPIVLARHNAEDGQAAFTPVEVSPNDLRKRLETLRRNQMLLRAESDDALDESGKLIEDSEDLENLDNLDNLGGFINMRRGGRSVDGSFQHRLLSSALDTSELNPEESLQASTPKQFPSVKIQIFEGTGMSQFLTPQLPRAPRPSPEKRAGTSHSQGSTGSPLKLFQPYDTFTNQTLLRRLSQFEDQIETVSPSIRRQSLQSEGVEGESAIEMDDDDNMENSEFGQEQLLESMAGRPSISISQFGAGELDGYEFHEGASYTSNHGSEEADETSGYEQHDDSLPEPQPRSPIFKISHSSSPLSEESIIVTRRRKNTASTTTSDRQSASAQSTHSDDPNQNPLFKASLLLFNNDYPFHTPKRRDTVGSEGKRARTSPAKDPTPKRRRTLHRSDIGYASVEQDSTLEPIPSTHQHAQSVLGRKRKDSRHGESQGPVDPKLLSVQQIMRPRTPTPSQRSSVQRDRVPSGAEEEEEEDEEEEEEEQQYSDLQEASFDADGALIPFARPVSSHKETDRKPSIKTEDFINEANKIMAMIRNKAGLGSGLASVEESESEHVQPAQEDEDSYQESTKEPFSRPPSRDGAPLHRLSIRQEDPEIAQRLKKYEEGSEMGDHLVSASGRSMDDAFEHYESTGHRSSIMSWANDDNDDDVVCDPPNIRISKGANHKSTESLRDGFLSTGSNGTHSTNRSIPTASSRGSWSRKTIAPESVEHLIPDQVGNMILDRQRNIWIKRKQAESVKRAPKRETHNWLPSEGSEEDPFDGIPDLTVDMTLEMRNLRLLNAKKAEEEAQRAEEEAQKAEEEAEEGGDTPSSSPPKVAAKEPIKGSITKLVGPNPLRSTAYSPDGTPSKSPASVQEIRLEEEFEHEIGLYEDRILSNTPRKRNLTITFSSPIASVIQDLQAEQDGTSADSSAADKSTDEACINSIKQGRRRGGSISKGSKQTSTSHSGSGLPGRQLSVRGETFVPRPVSRIEEREEETEVNVFGRRKNLEVSIIGEDSVMQVEQGEERNRRRSLSFLFTTPARPSRCPAPGTDAGHLIAEYVGNLSLTPMSDFTIHRPDQSLPLEVSYVVNNHHLKTNRDSEHKRTMSMTTKDVVEKLAQVEPFEPYWEDMQELDLQEKGLESLHQLDSFCGRLVTLDASRNRMRTIGGIPASVRQLRVTHNRLSSLTAWAHLMNLQYIDVSNNELTSLSGFKNLVHLRSLRADNNAITSLDGIKYHDGLQILRVRGNQLTEVDFNHTALHRLTELDLRGNQINALLNMDQLTALGTLHADKNELESLSLSEANPVPSLKFLSISDNKLSTIDLKPLPGLRLLHADRNRIAGLTGFEKCKRLDSLSLREQRIEAALDLSFLRHAYEVRKLYLSGNLLAEFDPQVDFLNLQLLELANCGLAGLPADLGQLMPNLRAVNVNFNALTDLAALRYIPRLKRLLAAGNRLADAAAAAETLAGFPHLRSVDLRDNPVTQGFYAPIRVVVRPEGGGGGAGEEEQGRTKGDELFCLPDQEVEGDERYASRLDLETRMRRRLYEKVVGDGCRRLRALDGLATRRRGVEVRDAVWRGLVSRGLVVDEGGDEAEVEVEVDAGVEVEVDGEKAEGERSEAWQAEDSFA